MSNVNLPAVTDQSDITLGKVTVQRLSGSSAEFFGTEPQVPLDTWTCDSKNSCCA